MDTEKDIQKVNKKEEKTVKELEKEMAKGK